MYNSKPREKKGFIVLANTEQAIRPWWLGGRVLDNVQTQLMLYFGGSNPIKYGVSIVQRGETPLLLIHNIAERRAFGFMIHALMLAVNNSNCESLTM